MNGYIETAGRSSDLPATSFEVGFARTTSTSDTKPIALQDLTRRLNGRRLMPGKRQDALVDRVEYPLLLREEGFLQLGGRGDPVARTHDRDRAVEVVEGQLRQV